MGTSGRGRRLAMKASTPASFSLRTGKLSKTTAPTAPDSNGVDIPFAPPRSPFGSPFGPTPPPNAASPFLPASLRSSMPQTSSPFGPSPPPSLSPPTRLGRGLDPAQQLASHPSLRSSPHPSPPHHHHHQHQAAHRLPHPLRPQSTPSPHSNYFPYADPTHRATDQTLLPHQDPLLSMDWGAAPAPQDSLYHHQQRTDSIPLHFPSMHHQQKAPPLLRQSSAPDTIPATLGSVPMMPVGMNMDMQTQNHDLSRGGSQLWNSSGTTTTTGMMPPYWGAPQGHGPPQRGPPQSLSRGPPRSLSMTSYHQEQQQYLIGHLAQLRASGASSALDSMHHHPTSQHRHHSGSGSNSSSQGYSPAGMGASGDMNGGPAQAFFGNTTQLDPSYGPPQPPHHSLHHHQGFENFDGFGIKYEPGSPS